MKKLILFVLLLLSSCNHKESHEGGFVLLPRPSFAIVEEHAIPANIQALVKLHNTEREYKGRAAFQLDSTLIEYAQNHAEWMAQHNKLKHSDISKLMTKFYTAGENIAWNQRTEVEVVKDWMNSKGHRENILNRKFTKIGFGVAYNSKNEPYWCTCFGG